MKIQSHLKPFANERGFSLIELMTVVAVLGIVAYLGASRSRQSSSLYTEKNEIELFRQTLQNTRNFSINGESCAVVAVTYDSISAETYGSCGSPPDDLKTSTEIKFTRLRLNSFSVGDEIQFQPGGKINATEPITMTIEGKSGRYYELKIFPVTGILRIK